MKAWTLQDRSRALQWRNHGRPPEFIARRLGRPVGDVEALLEITRKSADRPQKAERKCLCCGRAFMSWGAGNRLCDPCKRDAAGHSPLAHAAGNGCSRARRGAA